MGAALRGGRVHVQFRALCESLDHPEWATDLRVARNEDRVRHRQELEGLIAERVAARTKADWIEVLSAAGIPSGPVGSVAEALSSPHAIAREMVTMIDHPTIGSFRSLGLPIRLSGNPTSIRRHPPLLGEHTREVLVELGYDETTIDGLRADGIV